MLPQSFTPEFLRQLELVKIQSRRAFLGKRQGGHVSPKRGHGIEFSDYRQYELGDNPRHIDWGVYARSDRLYVKKYQEEQDLNIYMIIDASISMFTPEQDAKWIRARDIAMALAYVALLQQDNVMLIAPGKLVSPSYFGGRAIQLVSRDLMKIEQGQGEFLPLFKKTMARVRFPGVAIVLSDFMMPHVELFEFFNLLRARNLDVTAIQVLGHSEINPLAGMQSARIVDSETGEQVEIALSEEARSEYAELLKEHNQKLQEFLASAQIGFVQSLPDQSLSQFVIDNLSKTGLLK